MLCAREVEADHVMYLDVDRVAPSVHYAPEDRMSGDVGFNLMYAQEIQCYAVHTGSGRLKDYKVRWGGLYPEVDKLRLK